MSKKVVNVDAGLDQFKADVVANQEQFAEETKQRFNVTKEVIDKNKADSNKQFAKGVTAAYYRRSATLPIRHPPVGIFFLTTLLVNPTASPSAAYTSFSRLCFDSQGFQIPPWETYGNYNHRPPVTTEGSYQNFSDVLGGISSGIFTRPIPPITQGGSVPRPTAPNNEGLNLKSVTGPDGKPPSKSMSEAEFADKKAKGLCFCYDGKFASGHKCPEKFLQVMVIYNEETEEEEEEQETTMEEHINLIGKEIWKR
uniref:Reverse transcriptase domain-containing protein n=1 Tax=Tanacetum cinerariifolium TaxID=118510 RepID=A0A6L2KUN4_TANCI|nr:hypothetical protein [Tanacetum cinerariifolium]